MRTIRYLAHGMQARWAPSLILVLALVLLLASAVGAAGVALHAVPSQSTPGIASIGGPKDGCGGGYLGC